MASFNLGRIKGDKGDKGDTGAKGDKGDRGERGEKGSDAQTPVFTIGNTKTLPSSEEAYVELNTDDVLNPVLNFSIPRGHDGKDADGDMKSAVYDSQGINQDIFAYAKNLADACIKKEGGRLSGALDAGENSLNLPCVRNVSIATALPENGANGDICIIMGEENGKKLGECAVGTSFLVTEGESECEYIISGKNFHGENSVTLIRKNLTDMILQLDADNHTTYIMSDTDVFLETMFVNLFPERIKKLLLSVPIENNFLRRCFLLSRSELYSMEYFSSDELRCAARKNTTTKSMYFTRTLSETNVYYSVSNTGTLSSSKKNGQYPLRPAIVLPYDTVVENTEYESSPAVKLYDASEGVYVFADGKWKECGN
ncbi:MAG: collagen-like protein [Clostridia bacterium]|nr:collagen-like protein [Clostridia bacterium]